MKPRAICVVAGCGKPKLHEVHVGSAFEHEFESGKRPGLRPRSDKMSKFYRDERGPAVEQAIVRARGRCQINGPPCTEVATTAHEILTRGRGGGIMAPGVNELDNLLAACSQCNGWASEHPLEARRMGFLRSYTSE